ncbi:hypothetical protein BS47DRAFT_1308831 [Hydnum rufescens UP504]|uniref:Uncharacterized protein n=1 Tax=Hydnum rufescens UP504 TaxID=1448309 RepID=A0A9P6ADT6_9AGAM|nr:hypothetical protein BS47DRAFT_1308831 [Hydnum rufescens UP504]
MQSSLPPIDIKGLFNLDVDNDIWQDVGLRMTSLRGRCCLGLVMKMSEMASDLFKNSQIVVMSFLSVNGSCTHCSFGLRKNLRHSWQLWGLRR